MLKLKAIDDSLNSRIFLFMYAVSFGQNRKTVVNSCSCENAFGYK